MQSNVTWKIIKIPMIYNLILETWMSFAVFLLDLLLLKITLRREFQPFRNESKSRETTYIIMQYTNKFISWHDESLVLMFSVYFIFPVFKANQSFLLEFNVLYNLILNMEMFTYHVIKISSKILLLSCEHMPSKLETPFCWHNIYPWHLPLKSKENW